MTCLIGVEHEGVVYMGADSITLNGWSKDVIAQRKIFKRGNLMFAFGGNPRMAQIIQYLAHLPPHLAPVSPTLQDDEEQLVMHVIEPIRKALKEYGYTSTDNGQEQGASFLVGFNGKIWEVHNAFQVCRSSRKMCAMGVGGDHALGALWATLSQFETWTETAITEAMKHALATAGVLCSGVAGPFVVEKLEMQVAGARLTEELTDPIALNKEAFLRP